MERFDPDQHELSERGAQRHEGKLDFAAEENFLRTVRRNQPVRQQQVFNGSSRSIEADQQRCLINPEVVKHADKSQQLSRIRSFSIKICTRRRVSAPEVSIAGHVEIDLSCRRE